MDKTHFAACAVGDDVFCHLIAHDFTYIRCLTFRLFSVRPQLLSSLMSGLSASAVLKGCSIASSIEFYLFADHPFDLVGNIFANAVYLLYILGHTSPLST